MILPKEKYDARHRRPTFRHKRRVSLVFRLVLAALVMLVGGTLLAACASGGTTTPTNSTHATVKPLKVVPAVVHHESPGVGWTPIDQGLASVLKTDGDAPDRKTRDWLVCWQHVGDTTWIICPDGWVEGS